MGDLEPVAPGVLRVALRTPTLPPATHTNCYVVGEREGWVVDPASPYTEEQELLDELLEEWEATGRRVKGIFLTHHHGDHVAGVNDLVARFRARGRDLPVVAHPLTAQLLGDAVPVTTFWDEGDSLVLDRTWRVLHTPGHAPGHLCLLDASAGTLVCGDMVAGVGTILIDPREGSLREYLASLARLKALGLRSMLPSHGPVIEAPGLLIDVYVGHRHQRSASMEETLREQGPLSPAGIVPYVYPELPPEATPLAAVQVLAHMLWLQEEGRVQPAWAEGEWQVPPTA